MPAKFSYYEKQFMFKYLNFLDSLIIKSNYDASLTETAESAREGELYTLARNKKDTIFNYIITEDALKAVGISQRLIGIFKINKSEFYRSATPADIDNLLEYYRRRTVDNYIERNPYYLTLNGTPKSESGHILVNGDFHEDGIVYPDESEYIPLHKVSQTVHPKTYAFLARNNFEKLRSLISKLKKDGYKTVVNNLRTGKEEEVVIDVNTPDFEYLDYLDKKIPYHIARSAANFSILHCDESILSSGDTHTFFECYHISRQYVLEVPYIQEYAKTEELYDRFMGVCMLFLATLKFFSEQIMNYMRNQFPTKQEKRLFLQQYKLEKMVDIIDDEMILNEFISHIDEFIAVKGSDAIISKILGLFDAKDLDVYKYLLVKTIKYDSITKDILNDPSKKREDNYNISLVKVPINVVEEARSVAKYVSDRFQHVSLYEVASQDPLFGDFGQSSVGKSGSKDPKGDFIQHVEKMLKNNEQFSMFYTKYLGIVTHVDTVKNLIQSAYLFTSSIASDKHTMDMEIHDSHIPLQSVTIRDLFAGINYVTCLRHTMSDEIVQDVSKIASFIGFNTSPNLDELRAMDQYVTKVDENGEDIVNVKLPDILVPRPDPKNPSILKDDIFIIKKAEDMSLVPISEFDSGKYINSAIASYYYNLESHDALIEDMIAETDYNRYLGLKRVFDYNMYCKAILDTYDGKPTYTAYLNSRENGIKDFINEYLNQYTQGPWYDEETGATSDAFRNATTSLITLFLTAMLKRLDVQDNTVDAAMTTYVDQVMKFTKIMNIIELFRHYTVNFSTSDTINIFNAPRECLIRLFDAIKNESGTMSGESVANVVFDSYKVEGFQTFSNDIEVKDRWGDHREETYVTEVKVETVWDQSEIMYAGELYDFPAVFDKVLQLLGTHVDETDIKVRDRINIIPIETVKLPLIVTSKFKIYPLETVGDAINIFDRYALCGSIDKVQSDICIKHKLTCLQGD